MGYRFMGTNRTGMSEELSSADVSDTPLPLAGGDEGLLDLNSSGIATVVVDSMARCLWGQIGPDG